MMYCKHSVVKWRKKMSWAYSRPGGRDDNVSLQTIKLIIRSFSCREHLDCLLHRWTVWWIWFYATNSKHDHFEYFTCYFSFREWEPDVQQILKWCTSVGHGRKKITWMMSHEQLEHKYSKAIDITLLCHPCWVRKLCYANIDELAFCECVCIDAKSTIYVSMKLVFLHKWKSLGIFPKRAHGQRPSLQIANSK